MSYKTQKPTNITQLISHLTPGIYPPDNGYQRMSGTSMSGTTLFSEYGPTSLIIAIYAKELEKIDQSANIEVKTEEQYKELAYKKLVPEVQQVIAENMPQGIKMTCGSNSDFPIEISCNDGVFYAQNPNNQQVTINKRRLLASARLHENATLEVRWETTEATEAIFIHAGFPPGTMTHKTNKEVYNLNQESELTRFLEDCITNKENATNTDKIALQKINRILNQE